MGKQLFLSPRQKNTESHLQKVDVPTDNKWIMDVEGDEFNAFSILLKERIGFSNDMVREYIELHKTMGPISDIMLRKSKKYNPEAAVTFEGRGTSFELPKGLEIFKSGFKLPNEWGLSVKGGARIEKLSLLKSIQRGALRILSAFPEKLTLFDEEYPRHLIASRLTEYQYSSIAKEEYINWLLFFKQVIQTYKISSFEECFELGIPIMLQPSSSQTLSEHIQKTWDEKNVTNIADLTNIQLEETQNRVDSGVSSTILLLPGNTREHWYVGGKMEDQANYIANTDYEKLGRRFANLIHVGFFYEAASAHYQQLVHLPEDHDALFPFADFMDMVSIRTHITRDQPPLLTYSLFSFFEIHEKIFTNFDLVDPNGAKINEKLEREKLQDLFTGLTYDIPVLKDEIESLTELGMIFGTQIALYLYSLMISINKQSLSGEEISDDITELGVSLGLDHVDTSNLVDAHIGNYMSSEWINSFTNTEIRTGLLRIAANPGAYSVKFKMALQEYRNSHKNRDRAKRIIKMESFNELEEILKKAFSI